MHKAVSPLSKRCNGQREFREHVPLLSRFRRGHMSGSASTSDSEEAESEGRGPGAGAGASVGSDADGASSVASDDGRLEAYRGKFGEVSARRALPITWQTSLGPAARACRGAARRVTPGALQGAVTGSAWAAEADALAGEDALAADALDSDASGDSCEGSEDSSGSEEDDDSDSGGASSADGEDRAAGGEGAAAGKGAALAGEDTRGGGSAKSKRSARRYFEDEDSSVPLLLKCTL